MRVAGTSFPLTATTASQWLGALALDMEHMQGIVPGLIGEDDLERMWHLAQGHPDIRRRWTNAARVALGRAGGRDWWWTYNLCRKALGIWIYTNGLLLRQNVNHHDISLPDWLDACYTLYWEHADEEARIKLDMELSMRPAGVAVRQSAAQARRMAMDFAAD